MPARKTKALLILTIIILILAALFALNSQLHFFSQPNNNHQIDNKPSQQENLPEEADKSDDESDQTMVKDSECTFDVVAFDPAEIGYRQAAITCNGEEKVYSAQDVTSSFSLIYPEWRGVANGICGCTK